MKSSRQRALILFLVILVLVPVLSRSESSYASQLGMTMDDFILKYNALPAPLEAPYNALTKPAFWSDYEEYQVAWFYPESTSKVAILLLSKDTTHEKSTDAGLDAIQVFALSNEGWIPLLSISKRCADVFVNMDWAQSASSYLIMETVNYYYENLLEKTGYVSYRALNDDETLALSFGYADGYYFMITPMDEIT